jgi:iron complex outermembrane receptor protein
VVQISASNHTIAARGFSGNSADQSFSDKLLVLIDGRSVYSPLYSGVYWDSQAVLLDDIERIEVMSGPGATPDTQGVSLSAAGGNLEKNATARLGA